MNKELVELAAQEYINGVDTLTNLRAKYHLNLKDISNRVKELGYRPTATGIESFKRLQKATEEYINNLQCNIIPSTIKISEKYGVSRRALSNELKRKQIPVINFQNETKFNENIFDVINTEEKAYWLGFIYADGYIATVTPDKKPKYAFELSLGIKDIDHLQKFNTFIEHKKNIVRVSTITVNGVKHERCRLGIVNKHLWNTLNNKGVIPKKSLILTFPDLSIFSDKNLIKHFIRGYIDGDGCISYGAKDHLSMVLSVVGTESFLNGMQSFFPVSHKHVLLNANPNQNITKEIQFNNRTALKILFWLYEGATIYLPRKYERYEEICRLYSKEYKELQTNIGEGCDANTEITEEIKKSSAS